MMQENRPTKLEIPQQKCLQKVKCIALLCSIFVGAKLKEDFKYCLRILKCSKAISGWVGLDWIGLEISEGIDSKSTDLRCS